MTARTSKKNPYDRYVPLKGVDEESLEDFAERSVVKDDPQVKTLIRLGEAATLFHTSAGELYARVPVGNHYETRTINEQGSGFRRWLLLRYYQETKSAPSATAITQAMALFAARAEIEGQTQKVYTRVAYADNVLYLDLGTEDWRAVKISSDGWEVVSDYPVHFRRPNGIEPMTIPERGGSLNDLRTFINVATEDDWKMLVAWLLGVFHPKGPYAILAISGEAGTAHELRNEVVEQRPADLVGESRLKPDGALLSGVRTSGVWSETGSR